MRKYLFAIFLFSLGFTGCRSYNAYFKAQTIKQEVVAKAIRQIEWYKKPYNCKDMANHFMELAKEKGIEAEKRHSFNPNRCTPHEYIRVAGEWDFLNWIGYIDTEENKQKMMKWWIIDRKKLCKKEGKAF
jgi:hypothetical protein